MDDCLEHSKKKTNEKNIAEPSIWTIVFFAIIALRLTTSIFSHGVYAGIPLYIEHTGGLVFFGGALVALFSFSSAVGRIASSVLVDKLSRKALMLLGAGLVFGGALLSLLLPALGMLAVCCCVEGAGFVFLHTAITTAGTDIMPANRLGEGIGYTTLGQSFGMAIGPSQALWLTGFEFKEALFLGFAATALVSFLLALLVRYEENPQKLPQTSSYRIAWEARQLAAASNTPDAPASHANGKTAEHSPRQAAASGESLKPAPGGTRLARLFSLIFEVKALRGALPMAFFAISAPTFFVYSALLAVSRDYANPSSIFAVTVVTMIIIRLFFSKALNTDRIHGLFLFSTICGITALLGIYFVHNHYVFAFMGVGNGISMGFSVPLLNYVAVSLSPPERTGPANATFYLVYDIGITLGSFAWGTLSSFTGFGPVFVCAAVVNMLAFVAALIVVPRSIAHYKAAQAAGKSTRQGKKRSN